MGVSVGVSAKLTDIAVRKAKPAERPYKLADSGGLYIMISPTGARSWRMKYRFDGREKTLTFGLYPAVSLGEARDKRDEARRLLRNGTDPASLKTPGRVQTFETVARDWHRLNASRWKPNHAAHLLRELENDVFPRLGRKAMTDIDAPTVLAVLRRVEARGAIDTARRLRQRISAVFVYGIAAGICATDPAGVIGRAMAPMKLPGQRPALTSLKDARAALRACDEADANPLTKLAMRLLALTAVRPGELVGAKWSEFEGLDGPAPQWRLPPERMKGVRGQQREHLVPLSPEAVETVLAIRAISGNGAALFPGRRKGALLSPDALGALLIRAGFKGKHVPHGWRSAFSTVMNEVAEREDRAGDRAIIDLMLAHVPKDDVEKAYNRAAYWPRRREIAVAWAKLLLDKATPAASLLAPLPGNRS